jgi:hypothetical protein
MIEVGSGFVLAFAGVTCYLVFRALNKPDKNGQVRWRKYYRPALDAFSASRPPQKNATKR